MRTRWILAASILVLTLLPGTLHAAAVESPAPANPTASAPAAVPTAALPVWADLNVQLSSPQLSPAMPEIPQPVFLAGCTGCTPLNHCRMLHSCVLAGCC